jgi:O-acetylserine/cysteine efflux transporter
MDSRLPPRHFLLALAVVAVWGSNFVVIKHALAHLPPLLFAALRFALAFAPACLFIARPAASWRNLAAYGVLIGVGQFGMLYLAMRGHISAGLASLVVQTQVFFTIGLAMRLTGERLQRMQWFALVLAVAGIAVIAAHAGGATTMTGLGLTLLAALCWGVANTISRRAGQVNMLAYIVWSSAFAVPPLLLLSWGIEGGDAIVEGVRSADVGTWTAVLWQSVGNTLFGFAAWAWLLARHPAATITPMALLVPVFGMSASAWWLGEPLPAWKMLAAALVIGGLALNLLGPRLMTRLAILRA